MSAALTTLTALGQSTFQNLDFESASLAPTSGQYGGPVPISSALPGWAAFIGNVQQTQAIQNDYTLGAASIDVFGPNWSSIAPGLIDGNFTILLEPGLSTQGTVAASIEQTGTVPVNSESLQFKAWGFLPSPTLNVSFSGNSLMPVMLSSGQTLSGQTYTIFGADISTYAGQTGQLQFTIPYSNSGLNGVEFDDITFSPNAVPEPGTLALVLTGGGVLAIRRWRGKGSR